MGKPTCQGAGVLPFPLQGKPEGKDLLILARARGRATMVGAILLVLLLFALGSFLAPWFKEEFRKEHTLKGMLGDLLFLSLLLIGVVALYAWGRSTPGVEKGAQPFPSPQGGQGSPTVSMPSGSLPTPSPPPAPLSGEKIFRTRGCSACHTLDGSPLVGPSLKGIYGKLRPLAGGGSVVADEAYLREAILEPRARVVEGYEPLMPSYQGVLSPEELDALCTWLKGVK